VQQGRNEIAGHGNGYGVLFLGTAMLLLEALPTQIDVWLWTPSGGRFYLFVDSVMDQ
jgi:hypothetical protein